MALLTGKSIMREYAQGRIRFSEEPEKIGPNSVDLRIKNTLRVYDTRELDAREQTQTLEVHLGPDGYVLEPDMLYLASTRERAGSDYYVPIMHGRSSMGRLGLRVHQCAGFGDVGYYGTWTMQLSVIQPVRIYPNMRMCQLAFHTIDGDKSYYDGRYQDSKEAIAYLP